MSKAHMRAHRCALQDDSASLPELRVQWDTLNASDECDETELERLHEKILASPVRDMEDFAALVLLATDENEFGARCRAVAERLLRPNRGRWAAILARQRDRMAARHTQTVVRYTAPPWTVINSKGRLAAACASFSASLSYPPLG